MLAAHADHVAAPLPGVEQQFERQPRARTRCMAAPISFDFRFSPAVKFAAALRRWRKPGARIDLHQSVLHEPREEPAQRLQEARGGARS
jgi:hypothetical protein